MSETSKSVLHEGLKNRSPEACDSSTKMPTSASVNSGNRKDTAPTPKTLGPRHA